jgi:hypothetical protein
MLSKWAPDGRSAVGRPVKLDKLVSEVNQAPAANWTEGLAKWPKHDNVLAPED